MKKTLIAVFGLAKVENWHEQMWGKPLQDVFGRLSLALWLRQNRYVDSVTRIYVGTAAGIVGGEQSLPPEFNPATIARERLAQEQDCWPAGTAAVLDTTIWDHDASTTQEEVEAVLKVVRTERYKRVVLVSSPSHIVRVSQTFFVMFNVCEGVSPREIEVVQAPADIDYASARQGTGVVVVEPPHRLDDPRGQVPPHLWPNALASLLFKVPSTGYAARAEKIHKILTKG
jgi:hypothetical protein